MHQNKFTHNLFSLLILWIFSLVSFWLYPLRRHTDASASLDSVDRIGQYLRVRECSGRGSYSSASLASGQSNETHHIAWIFTSRVSFLSLWSMGFVDLPTRLTKSKIPGTWFLFWPKLLGFQISLLKISTVANRSLHSAKLLLYSVTR